MAQLIKGRVAHWVGQVCCPGMASLHFEGSELPSALSMQGGATAPCTILYVSLPLTLLRAALSRHANMQTSKLS